MIQGEREAYNPRRDGALEKYLSYFDGRTSHGLFYGLESYQKLWGEGWLRPGYSFIRLNYGLDRGDEGFLVCIDGKLEGIEANFHTARGGIHNPEKIFDESAPVFTAEQLPRNPEPHPLEGKYIVFSHLESDREDEGSCLVVYRMLNRKLELVCDPSAHYSPHACTVQHVKVYGLERLGTPSEAVVGMLVEKKIGEVVSISTINDFFCVPSGVKYLDDESDGRELKLIGINTKLFFPMSTTLNRSHLKKEK